MHHRDTETTGAAMTVPMSVSYAIAAPRAPASGISARALLAAAGAWLGAALDTVARWQGRSAERRHLLELDARMLKDMGLSRADVVGEASKPFWRP